MLFFGGERIYIFFFYLRPHHLMRLQSAWIFILLNSQSPSAPSVIHLFLFPGSQLLTLGSIQLGFLHCENTGRDRVTQEHHLCLHLNTNVSSGLTSTNKQAPEGCPSSTLSPPQIFETCFETTNNWIEHNVKKKAFILYLTADVGNQKSQCFCGRCVAWHWHVGTVICSISKSN